MLGCSPDDIARGGRFTKKVQDNIELNYREYRAKKTVLQSYPVKLYVEPTQRCNLDCITCSYSRRREKEDMPLPLFRRIEKELFPYAAEVNFFLTGEPTLARHLPEMMAVSANYTFLPKIFINGAALSDELAEMLVAIGCFVTVSFDAASPESFERIRRGAKFSAVVGNIVKLQKLQKRIANPRFHLRLASTLGLHNIEEAPGIVEFACQHDINDVMLGGLDSGGWDVTGMLLVDPQGSLRCIRQSIESADRHRIRFSCPKRIGETVLEKNNNWADFPLPIDGYAPFYLESLNPYDGDCGYSWLQTGIRVNGSIVSCCQLEHVMGNYNEDDFLKIWNSEPYTKLRSQKNYTVCRGRFCNLTTSSIFNAGGQRDSGLRIEKNWLNRAWENCIKFIRWLLLQKARCIRAMKWGPGF